MNPLLRVGAMKYFKHNLVDDFDLNLKSVMKIQFQLVRKIKCCVSPIKKENSKCQCVQFSIISLYLFPLVWYLV